MYKIRTILCPWHDERTPSCAIRGNIVVCMGCGKRTILSILKTRLRQKIEIGGQYRKDWAEILA